MIGAPSSSASVTRRTWRRWTPALAGLGIVTLAVTACGSSGGNAATPQAATSSSPAPASSQQAFPGVDGTAAAVSGSSMEVQNPTSGQVTVTFTSATTITDEVSTTSKDITVGSCVTVVSQSQPGGTASGTANRSITATTVTVSAPVKGSCTGAGGFGGFGRGPGGTGAPRASFSPRPRPSGSRAFGAGGGFGGASGKVTSLSASGFVVQGRNPAASSDVSVTVTTTTTTKYLTVVAAHSSALKVGECILAVGTTNSIGAVAARTIRISQPGPNGCVTGFRGGRGGFPGGPGGPSSNAA